MEDIDFIVISKHIFDNRSNTTSAHPEFDNIQRIINESNIGKITDTSLTLDLGVENSEMLIDLVNYYVPTLDINVIVNTEQDNLISRRLKLVSHFTNNFEIKGDLIFNPGSMYEGKTTINGDVDSVSLLRSIESANPEMIMRSEIIINGSLRGDSNFFFDNLYKLCSKIVHDLSDESIVGLNISISGKINPEFDDEEFEVQKNSIIRCWEINYENIEDRVNFNVRKVS